MKRNLILTLLACGAVLTVAAQAQSPTPTPADSPSSTPGPWVGHKHDGQGGGPLARITDALGLSGSQQAQIAPILEAAKPQMKAIHDEAEAKRKALIASVSSQITPLLTADQQTKFAQMVQNLENGPVSGGQGPRRFKRFGQAVPGGNPAGNPSEKGEVLQKLTTQLGLTADQQNQIKPILDAAHAQIQAIRQNTTLTRDQRFAQIKDAMEAAHNQINGTLTPRQQQQLASLRMNFHPGNGQPSASPSP